MNYSVTDGDINKLKTQIVIDADKAKDLLIKNKGDIVQCVLDSYNFNDDIKTKNEQKRQEQVNSNIVVNQNNTNQVNQVNQVNSKKIKVI